jgi:hypothetical protein
MQKHIFQFQNARRAATALAASLLLACTAAAAPRQTAVRADGTCDPGYRREGNPKTCTQYYINRNIDADGNLIVVDAENHTLRKISPEGIVTTILNNPKGNGPAPPGYSPSGAPALSATVYRPRKPVLDLRGNIYYASQSESAVQMINMDGQPHFGIPMTAGNVYTIAGRPPGSRVQSGYAGDGGPATQALLVTPNGLDVDMAGNVYIADINNSAIRMINADGLPHFGIDMQVGYIYSIAGGSNISQGPNATATATDCGGYKGDGGPATQAWLDTAQGVAVDSHGNVYIGDFGNNLIRRVDAKTGIITHVAGAIADDNGNSFEGWNTCGIGIRSPSDGFSGDGGLAVHAKLSDPLSLTFDRFDNLYYSDKTNHVVRKIEARTGIITTVAGRGGPLVTVGSGNITSKQTSYTYKVKNPLGGEPLVWPGIELYNGATRLTSLPVLSSVKCLAAGTLSTVNDIPNDWPQAHNVRDLQFVQVTNDSTGSASLRIWVTASECEAASGGILIDTAMTSGTAVLPDATVDSGAVLPSQYRILPDGTRTSVIWSGDGGPATEALLGPPGSVSVDMDLNLYFYDLGAHRYRMVPTSDGTYFGVPMLAGHIYTIAGDGHLGLWTGDGPARSVSF